MPTFGARQVAGRTRGHDYAVRLVANLTEDLSAEASVTGQLTPRVGSNGLRVVIGCRSYRQQAIGHPARARPQSSLLARPGMPVSRTCAPFRTRMGLARRRSPRISRDVVRAASENDAG